jgi:hypothetical protein
MAYGVRSYELCIMQYGVEVAAYNTASGQSSQWPVALTRSD